MAIGIHRDIYSGMVAEEMDKEGFFGYEVNLFAYYVRIGDESVVNCYTDELEAVMSAREDFCNGLPVSDIASIRKRFEGSGSDSKIPEAMLHGIVAKLEAEQSEPFGDLVSFYELSRNVADCEIAAAFVESFDSCGTDASISLLAELRSKGAIGDEIFDELRTFLGEPAECCSIVSGFTWLDGGDLHVYTNAYLPKVCQKRKDIATASVVSPIAAVAVRPSKHAYELVGEHTETLLKMFSKEFFERYIALIG